MSAMDPVLAIRDLSVVYGSGGQAVRAVDRVSLDLHAGEIVGLVGESGSGKSTLAYGACRLLRAARADHRRQRPLPAAAGWPRPPTSCSSARTS